MKHLISLQLTIINLFGKDKQLEIIVSLQNILVQVAQGGCVYGLLKGIPSSMTTLIWWNLRDRLKHENNWNLNIFVILQV